MHKHPCVAEGFFPPVVIADLFIIVSSYFGSMDINLPA